MATLADMDEEIQERIAELELKIRRGERRSASAGEIGGARWICRRLQLAEGLEGNRGRRRPMQDRSQGTYFK